MSVRTKAMTHVVLAAESAVTAQIAFNKAAEGLSVSLFEWVGLLKEEGGLDNLLVNFQKGMIEAEAAVREQLPEGETLSSFCRSWRTRKSALKGAIERGRDPSEYKGYNKFVADLTGAKKAGATAPATENNENNAGGYTPHDDKGGLSGGSTTSAKIAEYTGKMPAKAREQFKKYCKDLEHLFEANEKLGYDAMKVAVSVCKQKLEVAGGARFASNAASK